MSKYIRSLNKNFELYNIILHFYPEKCTWKYAKVITNFNCELYMLNVTDYLEKGRKIIINI